YAVLSAVSSGYPPTKGQVTHVLLTRPPRKSTEVNPVRLACIRHAASVDPEPGSNSPPKSIFTLRQVVRPGQQGCSSFITRQPPKKRSPGSRVSLTCSNKGNT